MILHSKRLILRPLSQDDWKLISFLRTDSNVNEFVKRSTAPNKDSALEFIYKIENGMQNQTLQYWVLEEKSTRKSLGTICLWNYSKDMNVAEIGYDLNPEFQRKGFMSESLKLVLNYAFNTFKFQKIEAYTHSENVSSKMLLENNGFMRNQGKKDEHNENNVVYYLKVEQFQLLANF